MSYIMRKYRGILFAGLMLLGMVASAAPTTPAPGTMPAPAQPGATATPQQGPMAAQPIDLLRAEQLIGTTVTGKDKAALGTVEDVVLNPSRTKAECAIVGSGGLLGYGRDYRAVPWQALQISTGQAEQPAGQNKPVTMVDAGALTVTVDLSAAEFGKVPSFGRGDFAVLEKPEWRKSNWDVFSSVIRNGHEPRMEGAHAGAGGMGHEHGMNAQPANTADKMSMKPNVPLADRRVTNLIGVKATAPGDKAVGDVKDMLVADRSGRLAYAIVTLASLEHAKADLALVPWAAIKFQTPKPGEALVASIDANEQTIEQYAFSKGELPDVQSRQYAERISRDYSVQPFWGAAPSSAYGYVPEPGNQPQQNKPAPTPKPQAEHQPSQGSGWSGY
jgi:sporulation protein YlmC with PRC-barrel domain